MFNVFCLIVYIYANQWYDTKSIWWRIILNTGICIFSQGFFFPDSVYNNVLEEITKFKTGIISGYDNNLITF